jgi:small subunit ribosomal protein S4
MVYRLGFANSRQQARQLVKHNHFLVNDKRVNIPSYLVKVGDVIQTREKSRELAVIQEALEQADQRGVPEWLELDVEKQQGLSKAIPNIENVTASIQTQLIVELYSK